jgi:hypothetical protein
MRQPPLDMKLLASIVSSVGSNPGVFSAAFRPFPSIAPASSMIRRT